MIVRCHQQPLHSCQRVGHSAHKTKTVKSVLEVQYTVVTVGAVGRPTPNYLIPNPSLSLSDAGCGTSAQLRFRHCRPRQHQPTMLQLRRMRSSGRTNGKSPTLQIMWSGSPPPVRNQCRRRGQPKRMRKLPGEAGLHRPRSSAGAGCSKVYSRYSTVPKIKLRALAVLFSVLLALVRGSSILKYSCRSFGYLLCPVKYASRFVEPRRLSSTKSVWCSTRTI
jgi:hypothetical protein